MMETSYNSTLVALSYAVSVLGSYTALQLAIAIPAARGTAFWLWLAGAAVSLGGCGIWAMHFIAMLAYQLPFAVSYDIGLTLASLLIAITFVGLGFFVVCRSSGDGSVLGVAGIITGFGVAGMHYVGMAAMRMPATMKYDMTLVAGSLAIAIVASILALWLAFNLRGNWQRTGSAVAMGTAVSGMHYMGMAAMTMNHSAILPLPETGMRPANLAITIFAVVVLLLVGLLVGTVKRLKSLRGYKYESV